jgi:two-component system, NarL family, response regulator LiaR
MCQPAQTRVVIVDDSPAVRMSLNMTFLLPGDITVVGEAGDGEEALRVCQQLQPDVVLMDLQMPRMDGFRATRALCGQHPPPQVIILTTFLDEALVREALDAGAMGYLQKDVGVEELIRSVRAARAGRTNLPSPAMSSIARSIADRPLPPRKGLTKREREVLALVVAEKGTQEIAVQLGITPATVSYHIQRICTRLGVASRSELAAHARQRHLVE